MRAAKGRGGPGVRLVAWTTAVGVALICLTSLLLPYASQPVPAGHPAALPSSRGDPTSRAPPAGTARGGVGLPYATIDRLETTPLGALAPADIGYNQASWLAYDPAGRLFFVAVSPNTLDVLSGGARFPIILAEIPVGTNPFGVAYDAGTGDVFVANNGSDNVSVVSATSFQILASIPVGDGPTGIAYDPNQGTVYVANQRSDTVSVLSGTTFSVLATIPVGTSPLGVAVDSAGGHVYVADHGSGSVTEISDTTNRVIGTLPVPQGPYGVAVDNRTDRIYVTDEGAVQVSAISDAQGKVVANYSLPAPPFGSFDLQGIAYDSGDGQLYIGAGTAFIVVLNTNGSFHVGMFDPAGVVYDPDTGEICVTNSANATFECAAFFGNLPSGPYTVTFHESGPAANATNGWTVLLEGEFNSSGTTGPIGFQAANGTYPYGIALGPSSSPSVTPTPGSGFVTVRGANLSVNVSVASNESYPIYVRETGLPTGTSWYPYACNAADPWTYAYDNCGSSSASANSTTLSLINGTYQFAMPEVAPYVAAPASGLFSVAGGPVWVNVTYSAQNFHPPEAAYPVTFLETGLGSGASWQVNLSGRTQVSTNASLTFQVPNGSYAYVVAAPGYVANLSQGAFTVNGTPVSLYLGFSKNLSGPLFYRLTFEESGLPNGTLWGVLLGNQSGDSTSSMVSFEEPNGSYGYLVLPVYDFLVTSPGPAVVRGSDAVVPVSFQHPVYSIAFIEIGLPPGANWTVTVTSHSPVIHTGQTAAGTLLTFLLPNGTYVANFSFPSGYSTNLSSTTFTVAGHAGIGGTATVRLATSSPGLTSPPSGGGWTAWPIAILVAVGLVAAFLGGWVIGGLRRARPPPAGPP